MIFVPTRGSKLKNFGIQPFLPSSKLLKLQFPMVPGQSVSLCDTRSRWSKMCRTCRLQTWAVKLMGVWVLWVEKRRPNMIQHVMSDERSEFFGWLNSWTSFDKRTLCQNESICTSHRFPERSCWIWGKIWVPPPSWRRVRSSGAQPMSVLVLWMCWRVKCQEPEAKKRRIGWLQANRMCDTKKYIYIDMYVYIYILTIYDHISMTNSKLSFNHLIEYGGGLSKRRSDARVPWLDQDHRFATMFGLPNFGNIHKACKKDWNITRLAFGLSILYIIITLTTHFLAWNFTCFRFFSIGHATAQGTRG